MIRNYFLLQNHFLKKVVIENIPIAIAAGKSTAGIIREQVPDAPKRHSSA